MGALGWLGCLRNVCIILPWLDALPSLAVLGTFCMFCGCMLVAGSWECPDCHPPPPPPMPPPPRRKRWIVADDDSYHFLFTFDPTLRGFCMFSMFRIYPDAQEEWVVNRATTTQLHVLEPVSSTNVFLFLFLGTF